MIKKWWHISSKNLNSGSRYHLFYLVYQHSEPNNWRWIAMRESPKAQCSKLWVSYLRCGYGDNIVCANPSSKLTPKDLHFHTKLFVFFPQHQKNKQSHWLLLPLERRLSLWHIWHSINLNIIIKKKIIIKNYIFCMCFIYIVFKLDPESGNKSGDDDDGKAGCVLCHSLLATLLLVLAICLQEAICH